MTFYPGRHYNREVDGANVTVKKFYTLGSSTIAVRTVQGSNDTLNWILSDHLGSASVTANADGTWNSEIKYTAFGEVRASYGLTPTDYRYTGQLDVAELGLIYFVARFYDPVLTHFVQADTYVPESQEVQGWDRYAYVNNNPVNASDPTGHSACWDDHANDSGCTNYWRQYRAYTTKPPIVLRSEWGAQAPGSILPINGALYSEGRYSESNPDGYMPYSEKYPDMDLADIYTTVVLHHEGDDATGDILLLQEREMANGMYDIPYHYAVGADGTIYEGRNLGVRGLHTTPNTGKVGIVWLGDYSPGYTNPDGTLSVDMTDDLPTQAQVSATQKLVTWLNLYLGIDVVGGHRDFNVTKCPGDSAYPYVSQLR